MSLSFDGLIKGQYGFDELGNEIKSVYENVAGNGDIVYWWDKINEFLAVVPSIAITGVLLALSLVMVFCGKRLLNFMKFVAFPVVGFCVGTAFLSPLVTEVLPVIPWWVTGAVIAVFAFFLSKTLYFVLYVGSAGYAAYLFCIKGYILPEMLSENTMIGLVAAAVAIVLALVLRNIIEMLGTSALGGFLSSLCVIEILAQLGVGLDDTVTNVIKLAMVVVFGVIGLVVQFKTRKRKW